MSHLLDMEAFLMVVEEGSFTAAAKRLNVTKSYASKLVSRLEDRIGVHLLQRTTRQLNLTEVGRIYSDRCSEAMQVLKAAEAEAVDLQSSPQGRLRISLPAAFTVDYLTEPLAEFKARYPKLTLEAVLADRKVDLLAEGFDVAVRIGDMPDSSLIARRLTSADRAVCANPDYLRRHSPIAKPEDLAQHEGLVYAYHAIPTIWRMKGPDREVSVEVKGSLVSNHGAVLVEAACQGLGVVFLPIFITAAALRAGRLVRVLPEWKYSITVAAVYPNARHVPAKVRLFVDFLAAHFLIPSWSDCA